VSVSLAELGIVMVLVGILLIAAGIMVGAGRGNAKGAAVVLIGPVPVAVGNDRRLLLVALAIAAALLAAFLLLGALAP
jgi:uncharacterized membrane protein